MLVSACQFHGQFIRHPTNDCKFMVCTYGHGPRVDVHAAAAAQFFPLEMECPNGVSVNISAFAQQQSDRIPITPCVIFDNKCLGESWHVVTVVDSGMGQTQLNGTTSKSTLN